MEGHIYDDSTKTMKNSDQLLSCGKQNSCQAVLWMTDTLAVGEQDTQTNTRQQSVPPSHCETGVQNKEFRTRPT